MAEDTMVAWFAALERRKDGVTWSAEGPTNPAPRTIPTEKVDRMRERCGLDKDFPGVHRGLKRAGHTGSRGTGRTTEMLLHALVVYEEGRSVVIVGQTMDTQPAFRDLMEAAGVPQRTPYMARFIDPSNNPRESIRNAPKDAAVFVDHWAAHQMVELSLGGAVVMESPN